MVRVIILLFYYLSTFHIQYKKTMHDCGALNLNLQIIYFFTDKFIFNY